MLTNVGPPGDHDGESRATASSATVETSAVSTHTDAAQLIAAPQPGGAANAGAADMRMRAILPKGGNRETFAGVSWDARFMLVGLWSYCDDEGRGLDATALIAATLFPFDLQNDPSETYRRTNAALDELAAAKLVWRCQSRGNAYLQVLDWSDWQRPARPNASRIPSPFGDEPPPPERVCETCGVTLHALRIGAKYCSNACRQRAFRYGNVSTNCNAVTVHEP